MGIPLLANQGLTPMHIRVRDFEQIINRYFRKQKFVMYYAGGNNR